MILCSEGHYKCRSAGVQTPKKKLEMKKLILISLCFILCSCSSVVKKEKEWLLFYNHSLMDFPFEGVSHFPFDFSSFSNKHLYVYPDEASRYHSKVGLILDTKANDNFFRETHKSLLNKEIVRLAISNDSIIFVGDTLSNYSCDSFKYPLPDFSDVLDEFGLSSYRLSGKEEVFLIEYKSGEFLEPEHLVQGLLLPKIWKHGMSRGIALDSNSNSIVYWLVYW